MKELMTGNEAIARGAFEAGARFASAYPGTPGTEILETILSYKEIKAEWAPNEKVALEAAIGASFAGARSIACMKHVGVNVAADPLFTVSYTGINGGLVLVTADEPGQHSSQNEQDNRGYAAMTKLAMLEPADSQECLDMTKAAFALSERFDVPVLLRVTTRVCHSKSAVQCGQRAQPPLLPYRKKPAKYLMVPAHAQKRRQAVAEREKALAAYAEASPFNRIEKGGRVGVVASGIAYHYAREVFGDEATYLKLGFTNPLPSGLLREFYTMVSTVYVIEENDPILENWVRQNGFDCIGKDLFPAYGEMTPDVLRRALGREMPLERDVTAELVVPRPPTLCAGCPHRGLFYELGKRKNVVVSGDIGCYTLGFAPPYNAMDTCICMGSAFSIGHGMQQVFDMAGENKRVIGVMGDSTFFHTGLNALTEVLYNGSRTICIILDNRITGMTGHQENPGSGKLAGGGAAHEMDIAAIVRAMGVPNVVEVDPNDLAAVCAALDGALASDGPSVIITRWPCVLKRMDAEERAAFGEPFAAKFAVDPEKCITCKACLRSGCPAISISTEALKAVIDANQCVGCGVCAQICPKKAIGEVSL